MVIQCCRAVRNLCTKSPDNRAAFCAVGCCELMTVVIAHPVTKSNPDILTRALGAFVNLMGSTPSKLRAGRAGACVVLTGLFRDLKGSQTDPGPVPVSTYPCLSYVMKGLTFLFEGDNQREMGKACQLACEYMADDRHMYNPTDPRDVRAAVYHDIGDFVCRASFIPMYQWILVAGPQIVDLWEQEYPNIWDRMSGLNVDVWPADGELNARLHRLQLLMEQQPHINRGMLEIVRGKYERLETYSKWIKYLNMMIDKTSLAARVTALNFPGIPAIRQGR